MAAPVSLVVARDRRELPLTWLALSGAACLIERSAPESARRTALAEAPKRMRHNRSIPSATVVPVLIYPDVRAAVAWLTEAFAFRERLQIGDDHRSRMTVGDGGAVILGDVQHDRVPARRGDPFGDDPGRGRRRLGRNAEAVRRVRALSS